MRAFVDTNVFLDVLMARSPWLQNSLSVIDWCEAHPGEAWLAWHSLSNLYYVGAKTVGREETGTHIDAVLEVFEIAPTSTSAARKARRLQMDDFEDALQSTAAMECDADLIITRNTEDFLRSPIKAVSPTEFLALQSP